MEIVRYYYTYKLLHLTFKTFFIIVFFLCNNISIAQQKVVKFENYSKEDGLLHSYVLSILQDSEGYLWVGSYGGLNRYDGTSFEGFHQKSLIKTPTNVVYDILKPKNPNAKHTLWLGTDDGLVYLHKPTMQFQHFSHLSVDVLKMLEDDNGILWLGTANHGLMKFDPETGEFSKTSLSKNTEQSWGDNLSIMYKDKSGNLWMGGNNTGLIRYNLQTDQYSCFFKDSTQSKQGSRTVTCIYEYGNDFIIGLAETGLHLFEKRNQSFFPLLYTENISQKIYPHITGIETDHEGDLWISTLGGGVYETSISKNGSIIPTISSVTQYIKGSCIPNSIPNNIVNVFYKDRTDNLWIGTLGGGLSKIDFYKHKFNQFQIQRNGNSNTDQKSVLAIETNSFGHVWYGTQSDGIYIYKSDFTLIKHIPLLVEETGNRHVVRQIYRDPNGYMWIGVDGGIFLFSSDGNEKKFFSLAPLDLAKATVHSLCVDNENFLWFGAYNVGLYKIKLPKNPFTMNDSFQPERYKSDPKDSQTISSNGIWAIYEDQGGELWVGTDNGLDLYIREGNFFKTVLKKNVSCILDPTKVRSNELWIGTYGEGLYLINKSNYSHFNFNSKKGLNNDNINGILEDLNGKIWVGTEKGLSKIDPDGIYNSDLSSISQQKSNISRIKKFYINDGLQGNDFYLNANVALEDGRLIFGGPNGFNVFEPQGILINNYSFPVKITDIKINNESIILDSLSKRTQPEYMDSIHLKFHQNYFSIEFNQINLSTPEQVVYEYKLEGYDSDWIKTDAFNRRITYTGIPEGDYVLKIKGTNSDGFSSEEPTSLSITIDSPWYRSTLFKTIWGITLLSIIILGYFFITKMNKQKQKNALRYQQEEFEKEKLKADLEYKNKELSSSAMYLLNRNEKLIEIKGMVEDTMRKNGDRNQKDLNNIISSIDNILKGQDNWENFEKNFNRIDTDFTSRLIETFPSLSKTDIKICTYMRMNLSSKEIASLLNIAPKSLETSRLRIRKKMNLDSSIYLSAFILKF